MVIFFSDEEYSQHFVEPRHCEGVSIARVVAARGNPRLEENKKKTSALLLYPHGIASPDSVISQAVRLAMTNRCIGKTTQWLYNFDRSLSKLCRRLYNLYQCIFILDRKSSNPNQEILKVERKLYNINRCLYTSDRRVSTLERRLLYLKRNVYRPQRRIS